MNKFKLVIDKSRKSIHPAIFLIPMVLTALKITPSYAYVGGKLAAPGDFPATVALPSLECGGAKVSKRQFVTAAHCLAQRGPYSTLKKGDDLIILSGTERSNYILDRVRIKDVAIHATFLDKIEKKLDANTTVGLRGVVDLAVITVAEDTPKIKIAALSLNRVELNSSVTVGGFGCESYDVPLEKVNADYINQDINYKVAKKSISKISSNYISVPEKDLGKKSKSNGCVGDSGGPAYDESGNVIGVNSFVENSGLSFTRLDVPSTSKWLKAIIR